MPICLSVRRLVVPACVCDARLFLAGVFCARLFSAVELCVRPVVACASGPGRVECMMMNVMQVVSCQAACPPVTLSGPVYRMQSLVVQ